MLVKTFGSAVYGVEAITITIEVNWLTTGKDPLIVGLPDNAVKESLQRIESTFKTNNYTVSRTKVVVNMAPADIKKSGTAFDLPIAIGILAATEQIINPELLSQYVIMGELSLDGAIRPIKGALPIAIQARKEGFKGLIVPQANAREAGMVNKQTLDRFDIRQPVYFADLNWTILSEVASKQKPVFREIPRFPAVQRDLAIVVDKGLLYEEVEKTVKKLKLSNLRGISLFDIFESEKLGPQKKSLAVSFTFIDEQKTLTDKEIDGWMNKIMQSLEKELSAEIRK